MSIRKLYYFISLFFIVPSLISLFLFGLKPSIDFTGGALLEIEIIPLEGKEVSELNIRNAITGEIDIYSVQQTGQGTVIIRTKDISQEEKQNIVIDLKTNLGEIIEKRFETVGPVAGKELLTKTITAIAVASVCILFFVAYRFKELKYGICAILAMFHDTLIVIGIFSILGHFFKIEVDILFVTAVLTILSFSVHDTIVVYDRIRETRRRFPKASYENIVNLSIAETLGRSVNNSMTIIFMLTALLLIGGITIRWFVLALLIGTITGTYSSTFTAAPLLVTWEAIKNRKKR
jgi:preprotein translocase subunit SecF